MQTWRFLDTGDCSPAENMAIDEAILHSISEQQSLPTIRFYGWRPASLSIGYFQKAQEINIDVLQQEQTGFVRRLTGGRAVLHEHELTYSIIVSEQYPGIPSQINEAYRVLSEGLLHAYRELGLDAQMMQYNSSQEELQSLEGTRNSAACFDAPSWYEVVIDGRKSAGSAQIRKKGVLLQHGSILLEHDTDKLFRYLNISGEEERQLQKQHFHDKCITINALLRARNQPILTIKRLAEVCRRQWEKSLGIDLQEQQLSEVELAHVRQLVAEKYGNDSWNFKK